MSNETKTGAADRQLTRSEVAARLGVSIATVRRMEGTQLHPRQRKDGVHLFDATAVEVLASSRPRSRRPPADEGEIAASAFAAFERGLDLPQVVAELRLPPRVIRDLYYEWKTPLVEGYTRARGERNAAVARVRQQAAAQAEERQRRQELHEVRMREREERRLAEMAAAAAGGPRGPARGQRRS